MAKRSDRPKVVRWLVEQVVEDGDHDGILRRPTIEVYPLCSTTKQPSLPPFYLRRIRDTNGDTYDSGRRERKQDAVRRARAQAKRWGWHAVEVDA